MSRSVGKKTKKKIIIKNDLDPYRTRATDSGGGGGGGGCDLCVCMCHDYIIIKL
jgi:hypothetical protein